MREETEREIPHLEREDTSPDMADTIPELPAFLAYAHEDAGLRAQMEQAQQDGTSLLADVELPPEERASIGQQIAAIQTEMDDVRRTAQEEVAQTLTPELEETKADVIDIEDPETDPEIKRAAADAGLALMREVLRGIDGYAVFASSARYLQGQAKDIPGFDAPPGDFDGAVWDRDTLRHIQERLANVPGVQFDRDGKWKRMGGGSEVMGGEVIMEVDTSEGRRKVNYPFEFFYGNFIVTQDVKRQRETVFGFQTLSLDGLQQQHLNNLRFENRVGANTQQVAKFLVNPEVETQLKSLLSGDKDPAAEAMLKRLDLTQNDLQEFYRMRDHIVTTSFSESGDVLEEHISDLAILLSGFKTKIPKRIKDIRLLRKATNLGELKS